MLATIENGFSEMSSVQTFNENKDSTGTEVGAQIGVSNVFAFLGINLKSSLKGEQQINDGTQVTEDRVHTPSSLFQRFRQYLQEEKQIKLLSEKSDLSNIKPGDFIEINGTLRKNPVVDLIEGFIKLMELAVAFEDKPKGKGNQPNENKRIMSQMQALCDNLKSRVLLLYIISSANSLIRSIRLGKS
jgi:LAS superfamily LD-carboxypeptidase LdcB